MEKYEELENLQKQKETGKISEKEFETKKKEILTQDERLHDEKQNNNKNNTNSAKVWIGTILEIILYIVAIIIVVQFFDGADTISDAGYYMRELESVSGNTVAEAFYNYYGKFLSGLSTVIELFGVTCGIIIAYIGRKVKCSFINGVEKCGK